MKNLSDLTSFQMRAVWNLKLHLVTHCQLAEWNKLIKPLEKGLSSWEYQY